MHQFYVQQSALKLMQKNITFNNKLWMQFEQDHAFEKFEFKLFTACIKRGKEKVSLRAIHWNDKSFLALLFHFLLFFGAGSTCIIIETIEFPDHDHVEMLFIGSTTVTTGSQFRCQVSVNGIMRWRYTRSMDGRLRF